MGGMDAPKIALEALETINDPELKGTLERLGRVIAQRASQEGKRRSRSAKPLQ